MRERPALPHRTAPLLPTHCLLPPPPPKTTGAELAGAEGTSMPEAIAGSAAARQGARLPSSSW